MINFVDIHRCGFCRRAASFAVGSPLLPVLFAAGYLAYALLGITGDWRTETTHEPPSVAQSEVLAAEPVETPDYARIAEWHLFGQARSAMTEDTVIRATPLQLKLLGTFVASSSMAAASAVIQSEDGSQKKYKLGDTLPGDAVLEDIQTSQVLLSRNGHRESLALPRLDAGLALNAD